MDFFTRCLKNGWLRTALRSLLAGGLLLWLTVVQAQVATDITRFQIERADEELHLNAQLQFDLPANIEDALLKGIPMVFVAGVDVLQQRWYWYDKRISSVERHFRLAYQPLTRRWRLNVTPGTNAANQVGLVLNQSFDTLQQAMVAIKRFSGWKIINTGELDAGNKYRVEFRFRLDLNQLPRPFQIGAIGQSDWELGAAMSTPLSLEALK